MDITFKKKEILNIYDLVLSEQERVDIERVINFVSGDLSRYSRIVNDHLIVKTIEAYVYNYLITHSKQELLDLGDIGTAKLIVKYKEYEIEIVYGENRIEETMIAQCHSQMV